ncbi:hypothetical protein [Synechococcus sp. PCC 7335]|nr:hypothetical protein [Synechococcus sp. PCC 7335]
MCVFTERHKNSSKTAALRTVALILAAALIAGLETSGSQPAWN